MTSCVINVTDHISRNSHCKYIIARKPSQIHYPEYMICQTLQEVLVLQVLLAILCSKRPQAKTVINRNVCHGLYEIPFYDNRNLCTAVTTICDNLILPLFIESDCVMRKQHVYYLMCLDHVARSPWGRNRGINTF